MGVPSRDGEWSTVALELSLSLGPSLSGSIALIVVAMRSPIPMSAVNCMLLMLAVSPL